MSETENNLKVIINFLKEAQKIGRPKLSNNKLEKSVSGSKESTFYDHNFGKWHSKKKSVEKRISDLLNIAENRSMKMINQKNLIPNNAKEKIVQIKTSVLKNTPNSVLVVGGSSDVCSTI